MENPIKMDDLGGKNPYFWFNTHIPTIHFQVLSELLVAGRVKS